VHPPVKASLDRARPGLESGAKEQLGDLRIAGAVPRIRAAAVLPSLATWCVDSLGWAFLVLRVVPSASATRIGRAAAVSAASAVASSPSTRCCHGRDAITERVSEQSPGKVGVSVTVRSWRWSSCRMRARSKFRAGGCWPSRVESDWRALLDCNKGPLESRTRTRVAMSSERACAGTRH